jgi:tripartite-type tricarboxylate transporter receptor subunit TctC
MSKTLKHGLHFVARLVGVVGLAGTAAAYPDKPVRIVVGYAPGGGVDAVARLMSDKLQAKWGKPVIVENRAGASGTIAEADVAKSAPDGHSLVLVSNAFVVVPTLMKLSYKPSNFAPISQITQSPDLLVINPKVLPVNTTQELIAYAKARPGDLNFGGSGPGSSNALSMLIFNNLTGLKMTQVDYGGTAQIVTALLSGEIQLAFGSQSGFGGQITAGTVKVLAVSTPERLPSMPEVPTVAESANLPGYEEGQWLGLLTTAGTPKNVVAQIHADMVEVMKQPDQQKQLTARGYTFVGNTPEEFSALIDKQLVRYADVLKQTGATK